MGVKSATSLFWVLCLWRSLSTCSSYSAGEYGAQEVACSSATSTGLVCVTSGQLHFACHLEEVAL